MRMSAYIILKYLSTPYQSTLDLPLMLSLFPLSSAATTWHCTMLRVIAQCNNTMQSTTTRKLVHQDKNYCSKPMQIAPSRCTLQKDDVFVHHDVVCCIQTMHFGYYYV